MADDDTIDLERMRSDYLLIDQACIEIQTMIAELRAVVQAIEEAGRDQ